MSVISPGTPVPDGAKPVFNQLARWFAVALVGLNAIGQMFVIPAYPFWSLTIIAVDVVVL